MEDLYQNASLHNCLAKAKCKNSIIIVIGAWWMVTCHPNMLTYFYCNHGASCNKPL